MNYEKLHELSQLISDYQQELNVIHKVAEKIIKGRVKLNVRLIIETVEQNEIIENPKLFDFDKPKENFIHPIYGLDHKNFFNKKNVPDLTVQINGASYRQSLLMLDVMNRYYSEEIEKAKNEINNIYESKQKTDELRTN